MSVVVLDTTLFPTTVRMAKVKRHTELLLQLLVVAEEDVVVSANGLELRELLLNILQGSESISHAHWQYLSDKANPNLPVSGR